MKDLAVTAKVPANAKNNTPQLGPATVTVKAPESIDEAVKMFGGEAVLSNALANWVVTLQGNIRSALNRKETLPAMQARLGAAKMGVAAAKAAMDPKQAWLAAYQAATPAERKKMKADLLKEAETLG